jgi:hypothetical protein
MREVVSGRASTTALELLLRAAIWIVQIEQIWHYLSSAFLFDPYGTRRGAAPLSG